MKFKIIFGSWFGEWEVLDLPEFDRFEDALTWISEHQEEYVFEYHGSKRSHTLSIMPQSSERKEIE